MTDTLAIKKPRKVATTIRLDPELKNWAREYAEFAGTDLSTFITITLTQVKHSGTPTQMYDPKLVAYNKYLDDMIARIDSGEEQAAGPFSGDDAIRYLESLMQEDEVITTQK